MTHPDLEPLRELFDPATIGDPLALQTAWSPASKRGGNYRAGTLRPVSADKIVIRGSLAASIFALVFLLIGLYLLGRFVLEAYNTNELPRRVASPGP